MKFLNVAGASYTHSLQVTEVEVENLQKEEIKNVFNDYGRSEVNLFLTLLLLDSPSFIFN